VELFQYPKSAGQCIMVRTAAETKVLERRGNELIAMRMEPEV
jgi:hypothetical protein